MMTFEELGVSTPIRRAIEELGYEYPMPVQQEVIPYLLGEPVDLIALAQTGTGKTAAFGLPLLQKIEKELSDRNEDKQGRKPLALVLCPTRELCLQIADDLTGYSKYLPSTRILPVYGGSSIESQIKVLRRGVEILVATPGRLLDLMKRGEAHLSDVKTVVLDEADEMLNMGFEEDLNAILAAVPKERHLLLFSATMPKTVSGIASKYLQNPKEIVVGTRNSGNTNIKHLYYVVSAKHKYLALKRIADYYPNIYGIVFCRTRKETQEIADRLIQDGYNADSLHGDLSQAQRDYVMQKFRIRNLQILVATDVAARGLDVNDLTHVIHYGLPDDVESYTHRSGRTARAGKTGLSIAICHSRERGKIKDIERAVKVKMERAFIPNGTQICEKQLFNLADRIERVDTTAVPESLASFMPNILRKIEWIERDDLIKRIMALEFSRLLDYYQTAEEIEEADEKGRIRSEKEEKGSRGKRRKTETGMTRLFINFGKFDRMNPGKLIELLNKCVNGHPEIGRIDLMQRFSFFDVEESMAKEVVESMSRFEVDGRRIVVDYAEKDDMNADEGKRKRKPKWTPEQKRERNKNRDDKSAERAKTRNGKGLRRNEDEPFYDRFKKKKKH
ncbi:DEAD/DEAH box helicase [Porphyromonas macacae]|uniref:DEAD/DEAH box helicase n=1 Tax=Porphyromonas macacae TaxID=28115 RepID=A0A0A2EF56_9PORP|nr:DEAD/DEAH box helicase [Porphyromonas macacae]KGN75069.1 DEAD/DEAH box helicase [Porphyromonas macacae]